PHADGGHAGIYAEAARAGHFGGRHQYDGQDQPGEDAGPAALNLDRRLVLEAGAAAMVTSSVAQAAAASPIVMMDATALAAAIAAKKLSCVEVMTAYLDHIAAINPQVNAIVALQEGGGLMAQARERDAQLARGEVLGPLHGLPHAVKDLSPVKGIRMTMGSPIMKDFIAPADALHVER